MCVIEIVVMYRCITCVSTLEVGAVLYLIIILGFSRGTGAMVDDETVIGLKIVVSTQNGEKLEVYDSDMSYNIKHRLKKTNYNIQTLSSGTSSSK